MPSPYVKDAFHERVVHGHREAVNPAEEGTKAAAHYRLLVAPGESAVVRLRLEGLDVADRPGCSEVGARGPSTTSIALFEARRREADEFYAGIIPERLAEDAQGA